MTKSELEAVFDLLCLSAGIELEHEIEAIPGRRFRFDRGSRAHMLLIELEGGVWIQGRHVRGQGYITDCEKYNLAVLLGWRVLRFCREHVESGQAIEWTLRALERGE